MQLTRKLSDSVAASMVVLITSILFPIIPCKTAPTVPNPSFQWSLCSLNPDLPHPIGSIKEYFGYTSSLTDALFITILISFIVSMVFFHYATKRKKQERR